MGKKTKNAGKKSRKEEYILYGGALIGAVVIIYLLISNPGVNTASADDLVIDAGEITNIAAAYTYTVDNVEMEILAVRASDGTVRTVMNTCQVCYRSGRGYYRQVDDYLVCLNCGNEFDIDDLEIVRGGCNPIPVGSESKIVNDDTITIRGQALAAMRSYFLNWRR